MTFPWLTFCTQNHVDWLNRTRRPYILSVMNASNTLRYMHWNNTLRIYKQEPGREGAMHAMNLAFHLVPVD